MDRIQSENDFLVKDIALSEQGLKAIALAESEMPGLLAIQRYFKDKYPLKGARITGCLHMTVQDCVLMKTLLALGAEIRWASCSPLSAQDHAAAAMASLGVPVFAWRGQTFQEMEACHRQALQWPDGKGPNLLLDDGAVLMTMVSREYTHFMDDIVGVSEETTSGIHILRKMIEQEIMPFPAIGVNNSVTKSKFDNLYGCRESMLDGLKQATNIMISGKTCVVVGYGDVGKGCAQSLRGLGGKVIIVEIDPICALQAAMEGYAVMKLEEASKCGHIFVTATGCVNVINQSHIANMRDGAIICNIGHYKTEIDLSFSNSPDIEKAPVSAHVDQYIFPDKKTVLVLADGLLVNLSCANGHPSFVMSLSFSNQVFAQIELFTNNSKYAQVRSISSLPKIIDEQIAAFHLPVLDAEIDQLSPVQADYLGVPVNGPFKPEYYRY